MAVLGRTETKIIRHAANWIEANHRPNAALNALGQVLINDAFSISVERV